MTSHDLINLENICRRFLLLDHGQIVFDGSQAELAERFGDVRHVVVHYEGPPRRTPMEEAVTLVRQEGNAMDLEGDLRF